MGAITPPLDPVLDVTLSDDLEMDQFDINDEDHDSDESDMTAWSINADTPVQDEALITFDQHTAYVMRCSLHRERELAVTSGFDEHTYVWHTQTGELLYDIKDNWCPSIVSFSYDGSYLAIANLNGQFFIYKLGDSAERFQMVESVRDEIPLGGINWMRWYRFANIVVIGSWSGNIHIVSMPLNVHRVLHGTGSSCICGVLTNDDKKVYAGYETHVVRLWDLASRTVLIEVCNFPLMHLADIWSVACDNDSNFYASGDIDGTVIFCNNNGPFEKLLTDAYIPYLAFSPASDLKLLAIVGAIGQIKIWNYSIQKMHGVTELNECVKNIIWISDNVIAIATNKGNIIAINALTFTRIFKLHGHHGEICGFDYNPRTRIALTVSKDTNAKIFRLPQLRE